MKGLTTTTNTAAPAATTTTRNHCCFHCYYYTTIVSFNPDNTKQRPHTAYIFSEELPLTSNKHTGCYMKQTEIISVRVILLNFADILRDLVLQITNAFFLHISSQTRFIMLKKIGSKHTHKKFKITLFIRTKRNMHK